MNRTFKNFYSHYFFILLIVNFCIDFAIGDSLSWFSLWYASIFTFWVYLFDSRYSTKIKSSIFKYERVEGIDGKYFLRITIHFDDPDDLGLNNGIKDKYVENVGYGLFGIPWGKPRAETKLSRAFLRDIKNDSNEY